MDKKYNILIVDDDKFLLDMYRKKFERNGSAVDVATTSEEVLTKLRGGAKPDIVILDIIMPGMDGIELLKAIRKEKLISEAAVIMLTNESDRDRIKEAELSGADGYIVKALSVPSEVVDQVLKIANLKTK